MSSNPPLLSHWIMLLSLGAIWGSSFMSVAVALEGFGPLQLAMIRIVGAAIILTIYAWASGREMPGKGGSPSIWLFIVAFGFLSNALPFSLLSWGIQHVPSGFAGVCMAVVPLLVLPLAHFFVPGERLTWVKSIGFFTGFAGTLILIGPGAFRIAGGEWEALARLACVGAACSYALGSIVTRLAPTTGMISYSAATLVVASFMITPYAIAMEGIPTFAWDRGTLAVVFLALFPTALATLMMVTVIKGPGPSFLSLVNYQVPLWSVAFGVALLGEVLSPSLFIALALILAGLGISQFASRFLVSHT